jgi:two-component system, NtrC family, response regulator AtoC
MRVLTVDDDPAVLASLVAVLETEHEVLACAGGEEALAALRSRTFDFVLTDLCMPAHDGFEVLRAAQDLVPAPAVVVLTATDTARAVMEALRLGASDYLVKPLDPAELLATVARAGGDYASPGMGQEFGITGKSAAIHRLWRLIPLLASTREAVLILGETGVGKDRLAKALHDHGPRAMGPFIAYNMAATPSELAESVFFGHVRGAFSGATADHAGLFERADGGTLFLDEVDSFPLHLQPKLLRVLESGHVQQVGSSTERSVDVRVVAASATDLRALVSAGGFRADLFYRLCQMEVVLPPLRERPEDIPLLIRCFLDELAGETGRPVHISPGALEVLLHCSWPGNCRELRHALRSAAVLASGSMILPSHLPRSLRPNAGQIAPGEKPATLGDVEYEHIRRTLKEVKGNRSRAARLLDIDRNTLARKIRAMESGGGDK